MDKRNYSEKEKESFRKLSEKKAPKSTLASDCVCAFVIGGIICVLGQAITEFCKMLGVSEDNVKTLTPCTLIFISCLLTGLGWYSKIAKKAGAGTLVPITGFANAVSSPAIDSKSEGYILGVGAKMFSIAGSVIVYGVTSSVIWGIIYYLKTVVF